MKDDYKSVREKDRSHINTLRFVVGLIGGLLLISLLVNLSQSQEPDVQQISIPPDIRYGAVVKTGEIHAFRIYSFVGAITQQLNTWREDGEREYERNIKVYRAYFTQRFIAQKYRDFKLKRSRLELKERQRSISPLGYYVDKDHCGSFHDACVKPLGGGRWKVWLDVNLREWQQSSKEANPYELKNLYLRVPYLVVYDDSDSAQNPWNLKIDYEYINEIKNIDIEAVTK